MENTTPVTPEKAENETLRQYAFMRMARQLIEEKEKELGRPLYFCVVTFGCQMNARDSEKLEGILEQAGYHKTEEEEQADFVIYNTCTVRENANLRVYGRLGYLHSLRKKNPDIKDCPVWLHDAGGRGRGQNQKELPLRQFDLWYPQSVQVCRAVIRYALCRPDDRGYVERYEGNRGRVARGP